MTMLLLTGGIGVGKTTVAHKICSLTGAQYVGVRAALAGVLHLDETDRAAMQEAGAALDARTDGAWLAEFIEQQVGKHDRLVVDAVRTERQFDAVRNRVPHAKLVFLDAPLSVRRTRFETATLTDEMKASAGFDRSVDHPTEQLVIALRGRADIVLDNSTTTANDTAARLARLIEA